MKIFYSKRIVDVELPINELTEYLTDKIKAHVLKYSVKTAMLNSAVAWNLLSKLVKKTFSKSLDGVDFIGDKPIIDGLYIGISHTKNLAVAAVALENFGVDFEKVDNTRALEKLKNFLRSSADTCDGIFVDWCRREAAIKFYGEVKKNYGDLKYYTGVQDINGERYAYSFSAKSDIQLIEVDVIND